ncbi:MAG: class II aldolase/adducin family protein [Acidithiobacillus sp.]|nr:class II aldolase/adducin family protein [Acidithiobacillus sp.]
MTDKTMNLAQELIRIANVLRERGLLFRGAHANLSGREDDRLLITRGGSVANLGEKDLAWLPIAAEDLRQDFDPNYREIVDMHTRLYQHRADVGAIIHCHPTHSTAFAVAQQSIPAVYEPMLRQGIHTDVPVVAWAPRGSSASVNGILEAFDAPDTVAVLLANHGVLVTGDSPETAVNRLTALEEAAELVLHARVLGGEKALPEAAYQEVAERMQRYRKAS